MVFDSGPIERWNVETELPAVLDRIRFRLLGVLRRCRVPLIAHEDLLQDLAVAALEAQQRYQREGAEIQVLDAYLASTLRNLCVQYYRKVMNQESRFVVLDDSYLNEPSSDRVIPEWLGVELGQRLATLAPRQREVVELWCQGFSWKEVAAATGYSFSSVRRVAGRAVARLRGRERYRGANRRGQRSNR